MRDTGDRNDIQEHQGEILGDPGMYRKLVVNDVVRKI
jgi:hypothetical protein